MEINLTAPRSWRELTNKQLTYISFLMTSRQLTKAELHAHAFVRFTGIRIIRMVRGTWICQHKKQRFKLDPESVALFCRQFNFLTDGITEINPLDHIVKRTHVDFRLRGIPFLQYLACENYYQAFLFTKDEKQLNALCAAFYTDGKAFNDGKTVANAKAFAPVPFYVRYTVFLWYFGLKSVLSRSFPNLFTPSSELDEKGQPDSPDMRKVINNMVRALSGGDVTKTKAIYNTETWTALAELDAKALEYKEYEKRMAKHKK